MANEQLRMFQSICAGEWYLFILQIRLLQTMVFKYHIVVIAQ